MLNRHDRRHDEKTRRRGQSTSVETKIGRQPGGDHVVVQYNLFLQYVNYPPKEAKKIAQALIDTADAILAEKANGTPATPGS